MAEYEWGSRIADAPERLQAAAPVIGPDGLFMSAAKAAKMKGKGGKEAKAEPKDADSKDAKGAEPWWANLRKGKKKKAAKKATKG